MNGGIVSSSRTWWDCQWRWVGETGTGYALRQNVSTRESGPRPDREARRTGRRGEDQVCRISAACWSAVTRSQKIPFTSHSAETPPHPRRPMRYEIASWISSQARARTDSAMLNCKIRPPNCDPYFKRGTSYDSRDLALFARRGTVDRASLPA